MSCSWGIVSNHRLKGLVVSLGCIAFSNCGSNLRPSAASSTSISLSTASKSKFSKSTTGFCFVKYLLRSSKPLKYQLNRMTLYLSESQKACIALAPVESIFWLTNWSCSSFCTVRSLSTLSSLDKAFTLSLEEFPSSMVDIRSFHNPLSMPAFQLWTSFS